MKRVPLAVLVVCCLVLSAACCPYETYAYAAYPANQGVVVYAPPPPVYVGYPRAYHTTYYGVRSGSVYRPYGAHYGQVYHSRPMAPHGHYGHGQPLTHGRPMGGHQHSHGGGHRGHGHGRR